MKFFRTLLWVIAILMIIILGGSFFLPKEGTIERSATINAPRETVFELINNLASYDKWMTWNQMDPNWTKEISANPRGVGATYKWESKDKNVGKGSMTITKSIPHSEVDCDLFFEGMGTSKNGFELKGEANNTQVRWYMHSNYSDHGFFGNAMAKWMNALGLMDKMVGEEFDKSLANLKSLAEGPEAKAFLPIIDSVSAPVNPTLPADTLRQ